MLVQYVTQDETSVFIGGNLPFVVLLFKKKKKTFGFLLGV